MSRSQYRPSRRSTLFVIIAGFVTVVGLLILGPETAVAEMCQWTGAVNTDWNNAGNWSCAIVPGSVDTAIIPNVSTSSGNNPVISTAQTINTVTIQNGGILTYQAGTGVTVTFTNFNIEDGGKYIHDRTASTPLNTSIGRVFSDNSIVEIKNYNAPSSSLPSFGNLIINSSGTIQMSGYLQSVNGDLTKQGSGEFRLATTQAVGLTVSGNLHLLEGTITIQSGVATNNTNIVVGNDATIASGTTLRSGSSASGIHFLSVGGNWTNDGTFTLNTNANTGVIFNGSSQQLVGGSSATEFRNLIINNGANVVLPTNTTVVGNLTNNGRLQQTRDVNGSGDVTFLDIGGYGGVTLNANSSDLGQTTVIIRGNQPCDNDNSSVRRCFDIDPANKTGRNATVSFVWDSTELGSQICSTMDAYHWNGASWGTPLTLDTGYGTNGRICTDPGLQSLRVTGVTTFSPFAMSSDGSGPTAVSLQSFTAHNQTPILLILAALLMLGLVGATAVFRHKTNSR